MTVSSLSGDGRPACKLLYAHSRTYSAPGTHSWEREQKGKARGRQGKKGKGKIWENPLKFLVTVVHHKHASILYAESST